MIPANDQKNLPEDENTPEKRAEKIWEFFGKKENGEWLSFSGARSARCTTCWPSFCSFSADKISEGEFIQGVMDNKEILRLIQYDEPQKIKDKLKEKKHWKETPFCSFCHSQFYSSFFSVLFYLWTHFVSLFLSLYTEMKYSSNRVDLTLFKLQFLSTKLKHRNMFNIKTELLQWRKVFWFKREELEKQVKTAATANWLTSEITLAKANFPSYFWWNVVFNSPTYQFLTLLH